MSSASFAVTSARDWRVFGVLSVDNSVKSRTSFGGTAPANVREQAEAWRKRLEKDAISG